MFAFKNLPVFLGSLWFFCGYRIVKGITENQRLVFIKGGIGTQKKKKPGKR